MSIAQLIVLAVSIYGVLGILACIAFLLVGIERIDPAARHTYAFRVLLIPGLILLWPLVLHRWRFHAAQMQEA